MAYAPNAYSMVVREHIDTGERFHCVCDYSPCRCGDEYLVAGVIITTNAKRPHNAHTTVLGQWQYCSDLDCSECLNQLPF